VSVDGAHDSGMKIWFSQDVLVEGGYVRGTTGDGYQIQGSADQPTSNVTFRNVQSVQNGKDGFVVPAANSEITHLIFDRTRSSGNGTVSNGDGYDVRGSANVPSPTPIIHFLDAEGSSNHLTGFKVWSSARFENVYAANNTGAGLAMGRRSGVTQTAITVVNSTVRANGSPQVSVSSAGVSLEFHNSLVTGSSSEMLQYVKTYTDAVNKSGGAAVDWRHDLVSRTGSGGTIVKYFDRTGTQRTCTSAQNNLPGCDATGDCDYDLAVTVDEITKMTNIALGNAPLSDCYQGDHDGDGSITIDELITAVSIAQTDDAHESTVTGAPTFQATPTNQPTPANSLTPAPGDRHLASGSAGANAGVSPTTFGVPVCRAQSCDADSHARPDSTSYDIGAYEGTGSQSRDSTCLNLGVGQCVSGGALASSGVGSDLAIGVKSLCPGHIVALPLTLSTVDVVGGLQVDIRYDPTTFSVPSPESACRMATSGYRGQVLTSLVPERAATHGVLRVIVADLVNNSARLVDGTTLMCVFKTLSAATTGTYPFMPQNLIVSSPDGRRLQATMGEGAVSISSACNALSR